MGEDLVAMGRAVALSHSSEAARAIADLRETTGRWHIHTADVLRKQSAEIERLRALNEQMAEALKECADSLEAEIKATYPGRDDYPIQSRRYERDMAPVRKARALTAARQETS